ncbi:hypothetical protein PRIPAC_88088 [Pristionchus pacificus]|uniref:Sodium/potassium-transporting ATPase subunit beta-1-interacting protein n=1 Tax=Pristionchus pacificus TaxID=54126 RepID=A0A2A6BZA2_PRIPA|nr:hypothetical protein PRIPAC_88088 [Pristionchus pacificus]|eukprot:PDM71176.1 hypothetical protein PRIPAC_43559 [Pristionchus pacificus]
MSFPSAHFKERTYILGHNILTLFLGWMLFQRGQLCLLTIWSILLILRLVTDLIGRLWVLVLADFSQLLLCIIGIFAVHQQRKNLLVVHLIGCFLIIASNVVLIGWWMQYFGEIDRPILSFGLPYSFSFWIKYTPQCQSSFESSTGFERQSHCWLSFKWIEAGISMIFIILALLSTISSIVNLCCKKKPRPPPIPALTLNKTHHTTSYPKHGLNFSSSHAGYSNSIYEDDRMRPTSGNESIYGVREGHRSLSTAETELSIGERRPYAEIRKDRGLREEEMRGPSQRRFHRNKHERSMDTSMVSREERETKTTSLISFDPKSPIPIQVHEMEESQSEDTESEQSVDDFVVRGPSRTQILRNSNRVWNESSSHPYKREDDIPATPVYGKYLGQANSSIDSAYGGSARRDWNTVDAPRSTPDYGKDHGLPLSNAPFPSSGRLSSFQIRAEGRSQMGGHYHSIQELQLVQPGGAQPTISRDSLLV